MPTTLTEVSQFTSTVAVPAAGDARTAASVGAPFQVLTDRTRFLYNALLGGAMTGPPVLSCDGTGSNLVVGPCVVLIGGVALATTSDTTINTANLESGGSYAVSTWYYVYAYNASGSLAFQISTVAPNAQRVWKNSGIGTHRYIGCFRTRSGGAPRAFRSERGHYTYRASAYAGSAAEQLAVNAVNLATRQTADLSAWLPPHARQARVIVIQNTSGGATPGHITELFTGADAAGGSIYCYATHLEPTVHHGVEIETTSAQAFQYLNTPQAGTTLTVSIQVSGFQE